MAYDVLVVEDNDPYRKLLTIHLTRAGYRVLEASNGAAAFQTLRKHRADIIVADIMMPQMDGLTFLEELRTRGEKTPVLIITAKEQFDAMRESFHRGADDYLKKPFRMEELLLRVEALLRRCAAEEKSDDVRFCGCTLSAKTLCVESDDVQIPLRLKEFRLLEKLAAYPGKIFTRQELMDDIWGYDSESDPRTVDTHIKRLREKLEPLPQICIQTVRGLGYRVKRPQ